MTQDATARAEDPAFVFTGGCAPLDLVATLGRRRSDAPLERMANRRALARWLAESGVAPGIADVTPEELRRALQLREATYQLLRTRIDPDRPPAREVDEAVTVVNEIAAGPALVDRLVVTAAGLRAERMPGTAAEALSRIARETVTLLGGNAVERVKECEHPDCSLLFLDETQAGRRRWCSMERCGNLVKIAGYRARRRARPPRT